MLTQIVLILAFTFVAGKRPGTCPSRQKIPGSENWWSCWAWSADNCGNGCCCPDGEEFRGSYCVKSGGKCCWNENSLFFKGHMRHGDVVESADGCTSWRCSNGIMQETAKRCANPEPDCQPGYVKVRGQPFATDLTRAVGVTRRNICASMCTLNNNCVSYTNQFRHPYDQNEWDYEGPGYGSCVMMMVDHIYPSINRNQGHYCTKDRRNPLINYLPSAGEFKDAYESIGAGKCLGPFGYYVNHYKQDYLLPPSQCDLHCKARFTSACESICSSNKECIGYAMDSTSCLLYTASSDGFSSGSPLGSTSNFYKQDFQIVEAGRRPILVGCMRKVNLLIEGMNALSSSEGFNGAASKAVDGYSNDGIYVNAASGACAHTLHGNSWIKLDLNNFYHIDRMKFVGRRDCCPEQSSGWDIYIGSLGSSSDQLCKSNVDVSGGSVFTVECDSTLIGRYITITSSRWMVLCEVEVYGKQVESPSNAPSQNPTQSPTTPSPTTPPTTSFPSEIPSATPTTSFPSTQPSSAPSLPDCAAHITEMELSDIPSHCMCDTLSLQRNGTLVSGDMPCKRCDGLDRCLDCHSGYEVVDGVCQYEDLYNCKDVCFIKCAGCTLKDAPCEPAQDVSICLNECYFVERCTHSFRCDRHCGFPANRNDWVGDKYCDEGCVGCDWFYSEGMVGKGTFDGGDCAHDNNMSEDIIQLWKEAPNITLCNSTVVSFTNADFDHFGDRSRDSGRCLHMCGEAFPNAQYAATRDTRPTGDVCICYKNCEEGKVGFNSFNGNWTVYERKSQRELDMERPCNNYEMNSFLQILMDVGICFDMIDAHDADACSCAINLPEDLEYALRCVPPAYPAASEMISILRDVCPIELLSNGCSYFQTSGHDCYNYNRITVEGFRGNDVTVETCQSLCTNHDDCVKINYYFNGICSGCGTPSRCYLISSTANFGCQWFSSSVANTYTKGNCGV